MIGVTTALLLPLTLSAATFTWTGATDGNWATGTNWDGGAPASATDTAIVFDSDATLVTANNISGGLTLNSLTFTAGSGVRTVNGNALRFDGASPTLTMQNATGSGITQIFAPIVLNQTLSIHGGATFTNQLGIRPTAVISGAGGLRIESGITVINSANTYSGATVVAGGAVGISSSSGFGNSPSVEVQSGGGIQLVASSSSVSVNKPLTLAGQGTEALGFYALAATGGNGTWSGPVTLAGNAAVRSFNSGVLTLSGGVNLAGHTLALGHGPAAADIVSVSSVVSGTGGILVVGAADAAGRARMTGASANTFTGGIELRDGTLAINHDNKLGNAANTLTLRDGGVLRAEATFFANVVIPASRTIVFGPGGGGFSGGEAFETLTVQASLGGSQPISIHRGAVALDAVNTFDGILRLEPGSELYISNESALGSTSSTIQLHGGDTSVADNAQIVLQGAASLSAARTVQITGDRGGIIVDAGKTLAATFTGAGRLELTGLGNSVIQLSAANSQAGGTRIASGVLLLDSDARIGAPGGALGIGVGATLRAANDLVLDAGRAVVIGNGGPSPRIDTNGFDLTIGGDLINDGVSADLLKLGGGTLVLNGTSSIGGLITVQAGGLGGSGTIVGNVAVVAATLAPGNSAGAFTIDGDLTVTAATIWDFQIGGTAQGTQYDFLSEAGAAQFNLNGGTLQLSLIDSFTPGALDTFTIFSSNNAILGTFGNLDDFGRVTVNGGSFLVSVSGSNVTLSNFAAVPEPATWGAILAFAMLAFAAMRRRHAPRLRANRLYT